MSTPDWIEDAYRAISKLIKNSGYCTASETDALLRCVQAAKAACEYVEASDDEYRDQNKTYRTWLNRCNTFGRLRKATVGEDA